MMSRLLGLAGICALGGGMSARGWRRRLRLFGLVVFAVLGLSAIPAAASSSGWSVVATANPAVPTGALFGDSCSSSTFCIAVGQYTPSSGAAAVEVQRWDGTRWINQKAPNPAGGVSSGLSDVSCLTASSCLAVGDSFNSSGVDTTLSERWDGRRWTIVPSPNPPGATQSSLNGVSCSSSSSCEAVGQTDTATGSAPLAEHWDGRAWTIQPIPNPGGNSQGLSVSCSSASACEAVGQTFTDSGVATLAEGWNGRTWSVQPTPNPPGGGYFSGVSCASATFCVAVGDNGDNNAGLVEVWNGKKWRIQTTPTPPGDVSFLIMHDVSCTSSSACEAVANFDGGTLVEAWDGKSWTIQSSPNPQDGFGAVFGVDCPAISSCVAAGTVFGNSSGNLVSFSMQFAGNTWQLRPTADPTGAGTSQLGYLDQGSSVTCPSTTTCVAVGTVGGEQYPLVERSDRARWSIQQTPSLPGRGGLSSASCTSPSACTAVGSYTDPSGVPVTLAERWNGSGWAIQPTPNPPGSGESHLFAVSCSSSSSCTAVGEQHPPDGTTGGLAEHWNGNAWSIQSIPTPAGDQFVSMTGVSCPTASFCMATAFSDSGALTEQWDGTSWSIVPSVPLGADSGLNAVSCTSPSFCMAVGGSAVQPLLAEKWDGTTWSLLDIPTPPNTDGDYLNGVSCTDSSHCTAVGLVSGFFQPFIVAERWVGTSWSDQPTATLFAFFDINPPSVACASVSTCTLATGYNVGGNQTTLAEQLNGATSRTAAATVAPTAGAPTVEGPLTRATLVARDAPCRSNNPAAVRFSRPKSAARTDERGRSRRPLRDSSTRRLTRCASSSVSCSQRQSP